MKKLGLLLGTLLVSSALFAQILNQPLTGRILHGHLLEHLTQTFANDPTTTANFGYDDDGAGSGSIDDLVATSPVIDLSAAIAGGEDGLQLDILMDHYSNFGAILSLEYFDVDATHGFCGKIYQVIQQT